MLFSRKKEFGGTYSYLIVGLGNPGPKYEICERFCKIISTFVAKYQ